MEAEIPVVTAFTATASAAILEKVKTIVFPDSSPNIISANPDRPNISYRVIRTLSKDRELVTLLESSQRRIKRPALVFCRSRTGAELTARMLRERLNEKEVFFYHAGLEREEKANIEKWFFESGNGILASTTAYGMGVDKSNIRTVIHRDISPSIESYLQESGRGGRDRKSAEAILLFSAEDIKNADLYGSGISGQRYAALIKYAENLTVCRREYLLSLLDAEPDACFGCDICRKEIIKNPEGEETVINFINKNRRRYTNREIALILSGKKNSAVLDGRLYRKKGFGLLHGWEVKDILDILCALACSGRIKIYKKGFWRYKTG